MSSGGAFARRLTRIAEERTGILVALLSLFYLAATFYLASRKLFWNDELFTYYISRQPGFSKVWAALLTGAEQTPPLFYLITRAFAGLFGSGYIAFRLPEIFGFWIMTLSLYLFVSRRSNKMYGLLAMAFPLTTECLAYSVEARAYSLVLAFSGAALVSWQAAAEGRRRAVSLVGLSLSLAAALSCHYYAILVFFPFGIAEVVRFAVRRRLDVPMGIALAAALTPLLAFAPLIQAAQRYSGTFWTKPQWTNIVGFYHYLLNPALLLFLCVPLVLSARRLGRVPETNGADTRTAVLPPWEIAAAAAFALLPFLAVFLAKTITGAFTNRYALPTVIGVSILFAWSIALIERNRSGVPLLLTGVTAICFVFTGAKVFLDNARFSVDARTRFSALQKSSQNGTIQIVTADPQRFLEISHLGGEHGVPWLVYLADRDLALKYTGTDDVELGLMNLKQWAPLHVESFRDYMKGGRPIVLDENGHPFGWLFRELTARGWDFVLNSSTETGRLWKASPPGRQGATRSAGTETPLRTTSGRE